MHYFNAPTHPIGKFVTELVMLTDFMKSFVRILNWLLVAMILRKYGLGIGRLTLQELFEDVKCHVQRATTKKSFHSKQTSINSLHEALTLI